MYGNSRHIINFGSFISWNINAKIAQHGAECLIGKRRLFTRSR